MNDGNSTFLARMEQHGKEGAVAIRETFSQPKRRRHGFVPLRGKIEDFGPLILFDMGEGHNEQAQKN